MALTEPLEAAVVVTVHNTEPVVPKRLSLPSMGALCCTWALSSAGFGWYSDHSAVAPPSRNRPSMQAMMARLWRRSLT